MLDAFIIEKVQKQKEQDEANPVPLTLELPVPENRETEDPKTPEQEEDPAVTFRF